MSNVHAGFDATGSKCSGHAQQGTINLSKAIQARWGGSSVGIYACRPPRGQTSGLSEHGEGRAYDHGWSDVPSGFEICNVLIDRNADLGIEEVIWDRKIWSYKTPYWHHYGGSDPHTGHIHVGQNWSGAHWLQYADAVTILGGAHPAPAPSPAPSPAPTYGADESELSMLPRCVHFGSAIFLVGYDHETGQPWRRTMPNPSRLAQIVGGGGCVTDHGNAFETTNSQFMEVYLDRGVA